MLKDGEPLPEIYTDPAFGQSSHWELSTSQLSSRYLDGWGYGEGGFFYHFGFSSLLVSFITTLTISFFFQTFTVVPDGYGLSYSIGDDYIRWTITSLKRNTAELKHHLAEAASEVRNMLIASVGHAKGKL
jgi:carnitine O-acetyltransferase